MLISSEVVTEPTLKELLWKCNWSEMIFFSSVRQFLFRIVLDSSIQNHFIMFLKA